MGETNMGPGFEARCLVRAARVASLATVGADGAPFAALVTPATAADGSVLMLLSGLSGHTRDLQADGRCALLAQGAAPEPNPQTAPRVTLMGRAAPEPDPALKARWLAVHPYAAFYAELGDFRLWRMMPERGNFVGGFARAFTLAGEALLAPLSVADSEARIIEHCNTDHPDAMEAIGNAHGLDGPGWRMVACDADGFDLSDGSRSGRVAFGAPVEGPGGVRAALVDLAGAAKTKR